MQVLYPLYCQRSHSERFESLVCFLDICTVPGTVKEAETTMRLAGHGLSSHPGYRCSSRATNRSLTKLFRDVPGGVLRRVLEVFERSGKILEDRALDGSEEMSCSQNLHGFNWWNMEDAIQYDLMQLAPGPNVHPGLICGVIRLTSSVIFKLHSNQENIW